MASEIQKHKLHIFFLPFLGHGHIIPIVDMAKLFASRGVRSTIITTPLNIPIVSTPLQESNALDLPINIIPIEFPSKEAGLPEGCENEESMTSQSQFPVLLKATTMLQEPLEKLLEEHHPDCLIAGYFFPWATASAAKFGIPRILFHGTGYFSLCAGIHIRHYQPHKDVVSDSDTFVIPGFPGKEIQLTRMVLPTYMVNNEETFLARMFKDSIQSDATCFGVVVNSFYELEGIYADHYKTVLGRKSWHIGPVSLCNRDTKEKSSRGKKASVDVRECLRWLDSKKLNSVIYLSFGSTTDFTEPQLKEIAMGLEACGHNFIWVVRKIKDEDQMLEWLPEGFEERMEGKGLIIRGWAPQLLILDHESIGGIVTHCGWNSTLEGVSAGVPMVTWPLFAEQFHIEKLVTEVLRIGVPVGVKKYVPVVGDYVEKAAIVKAVKAIMEGEKAEDMRNRAKKLARMAKAAVEEGGSSYTDLNSLIDELAAFSN